MRPARTLVLAAMKTFRVRRFIALLALAPLLAAFSSAPARVSFVCDGDSIARQECCCPKDPTASPKGSEGVATLTNACCCRLHQPQASLSPAAGSSRETVSAVAKVSFWASFSDAAAPHRIPLGAPALTWRLAHPPPRSIPPLVAKQTLLI